MTHDAIRATWAMRGPVARASAFRIIEDEGRLDLIADFRAPGRLLRAFRTLPMDAPDEDIEAALDGLYADLGGLPALADAIKARSFSEHLESE
jgi:hypothetical protein